MFYINCWWFRNPLYRYTPVDFCLKPCPENMHQFTWWMTYISHSTTTWNMWLVWSPLDVLILDKLDNKLFTSCRDLLYLLPYPFINCLDGTWQEQNIQVWREWRWWCLWAAVGKSTHGSEGNPFLTFPISSVKQCLGRAQMMMMMMMMMMTMTMMMMMMMMMMTTPWFPDSWIPMDSLELWALATGKSQNTYGPLGR